MIELEHEQGVPVAYVKFTEESKPSAQQVVISLSDLSFNPTELIFDVGEDGIVNGVELL